MTRTWASALAVAVALVRFTAPTAGQSTADAAFERFFDAATPADADDAASLIASSGLPFDAVFERLSRGRSYHADVPRGLVQAQYTSNGTTFYYALDVPSDYTPTRTYPVRVQLHGGVGRLEASAPLSGAAGGRLSEPGTITVLPTAWRDAPWWSERQVANLRAILDRVRRTYNVDENRITLMGVSDGGTGVYFEAMRDPTPFASMVPLNGFLMVLKNEMDASAGDVFPQNLVNSPFFAVNGGRDPLYPTAVVDPIVAHLKDGGVDLTYRPQPNAGHDTSWWPELKDEVARFIESHPRQPFPRRLSWQTSQVPSRTHWLVIDRLGERGRDRQLPDVNLRASAPVPDFGIRSSGTLIHRVVAASNAEQLGLRAGDIITSINNQPTNAGTDLIGALSGFPAGRPIILGVNRAGAPLRLTGRYNPSPLPDDSRYLLPPERPSGRVDLVQTGNRIEVTTSGVSQFTLLLSPSQFDLAKPVTVVVDERVAFEGVVSKDVQTLLRWAARDNDRTMLFAAELPVSVE